MIISKDGKTGLLASAPTKEALQEAINGYFFSNGNVSISDDGTIYNSKLGKTLDGYTAYKQGKSWRFEVVFS